MIKKKEINHHEGHMVKLSNGYYYSLLKFLKKKKVFAKDESK